MECERKENSTFTTILLVVVFLSIVAIFAVPKFSSAERIIAPEEVGVEKDRYVPSVSNLYGQDIDAIAGFAESWVEETE